MTQAVFSFLFSPLSKLPAGALELENQLAALLIIASFGQIKLEGRREGKKDPGPNLLRALFSGGNLENPLCLLRRQVFIFSAASVILFQILKAFLPSPQNNHFICSGDVCKTSLKKRA